MLLDRLSTLSHPHRMDVFRLLMRRCPDAVPAGEIVDALRLKPSTASTYLSALTSAGVITQRREATRLLYTVNLDAVRDVVGGLFLDCCRGRADLCPPQIAEIMQSLRPQQDSKFNVLFVCTGNSARSIFAETILRDVAGDRFVAYSAGTENRSELNPFALEVLQAQGHDVSPLQSKNVDCLTWPGQPVSGHWGLPDPVKATGTDAEKRLAFHQTYGALHNRISAFTALSFDLLDRRSLQENIDKIGADIPPTK